MKRTERGWPAHFCCSHNCMFRRNTALEHEGRSVVVSTVGMLIDPLQDTRKIDRRRIKFVPVGPEYYFETMAFLGKSDGRYLDADTSKQIYFDHPWNIPELDADDKANDMHDAVVEELAKKLEDGII